MAKNNDESLTGNELLALPEFDTPPADPFSLFMEWITRAKRLGVVEPKAFCLATVDAQGRPSTRTVLLKRIDDDGLVFVSNYQSRKGQQLRQHPYAAATFYWKELMQQVHIEGAVKKTHTEQSDELFNKRPYQAQIAAYISHQSTKLHEEAALLNHAAALIEENHQVSRPNQWGGYLLIPDRFEFWYGRKNRLHRRLEYTARRDQWVANRLQP